MVNRRSFLQGIGSLTLASLLSGCEKNYDLKVALLQGSIPIQLIAALSQQSRTMGIVNFESQATLEDIYNLLLKWQGKNVLTQKNKSPFLPNFSDNKSTPNDLVTLGNYSLNLAIAEKLIEPLELNKLQNWQNIPQEFQNLTKRNEEGKLDNNGKIWGAAYRWGCVMIAYRNDKFASLGWQPQDWQDLWRQDITRQISLLNQPREVLGLILKKLGYSYNTENLNTISELKSEWIALQKQVKFYDDINYLQPLILGDTWLAVGWSTDILPIVEKYSNISAVIPKSGTSLWADIWVKPRQETNNPQQLEKIYDFIDFCWEEKSAKQINLFTNGVSPLKSPLKSNPKIPSMSSEVFAKSEFIDTLPELSIKQYQQLWKTIV
ncbi:MAG: extracellular solute-binding protein [Cyanobacteria bacterium]|nr:extracellular solute-binding protein [Cyanobacteria bacterium CG_2015-22_32_23]NCQ03771.1 extracellular solute-binding protein [Cyanobacteria bacterium CG_2015-09_32_10]NCQ43160.1 extracellular solute-binding protein [Cyanobacteria bacterium CG_2015-04_32_10]NCS84372.1 extracellular solute-binding protein [Cyanobacteria bacterium CG_2015-02_32_10]